MLSAYDEPTRDAIATLDLESYIPSRNTPSDAGYEVGSRENGRAYDYAFHFRYV